MREIKFRAWDEQNKILHRDFQFIKTGDEVNDWIIFVSDKQKLDSNPHAFQNPHFSRQFKISQYTCLKDKNGKEIYEGDILGGNYVSADNSMGILPNGWNFHEDEDRFLVIWDNERSGWTFDFKKTIPEDVISEFGEYADAYMCKWNNHARHLLTDEVGEVLGNKYENPELSEDK
jgi:uncharacterized phage protein (TIGR01671 family)